MIIKWLRSRRREKIASDPAVQEAQRRLMAARAKEIDVARVVTDTSEVLNRNNIGPALAHAFKEEPRWRR